MSTIRRGRHGAPPDAPPDVASGGAIMPAASRYRRGGTAALGVLALGILALGPRVGELRIRHPEIAHDLFQVEDAPRPHVGQPFGDRGAVLIRQGLVVVRRERGRVVRQFGVERD